MANVKIYISCHTDSAYRKDEVFCPVQTGCAVPGHVRLDGMLHDDEGENISALNSMYCELTAQYWAWKNQEADYYGFCHYRRYFIFSEKQYPEDAGGNVLQSRLTPASLRKLKICGQEAERLASEADIIIPRRQDLRNMAEKFQDPVDQYRRAPYLHIEDLKHLAELIDERTPEYSAALRRFLRGHECCFCNMYILRSDIFREYCGWMFPILEEFCERTDMSLYSREALRTPGHLAERMFNIFLIRYLEEHPQTRVKELQVAEFQNTEPYHPLTPAFPGYDGAAVPVIFACSREYLSVFSVCLRSVLDHVSASRCYDIVVLIRGIDRQDRETLLRMTAPLPNVSLRFFDPAPLVEGFSLKANAHISVETFYRFLIQEILPAYRKVLYLDSDLIALADVGELYETDLRDCVLGAVRDIDFLGQIGGYDPDTQKYCREQFHMKDPQDYFQAGVLLLDEEKMRALHTTQEWLSLASSPHRFNDQDVLNEVCEGHVHFLPMEWNLVTDAGHSRISGAVKYAPAAVQDDYFQARKAPKIVHYAGAMKPWQYLGEDFGDIFWESARRSPFYESLAREVKQAGDGSENLHDRIRGYINEHFPAGSPQRRKIDRLYAKFYLRH